MELKETIEKRRSLRNLETFEVTKELIHRLSEAASLAPSCFNKQPWRYVFVHEKNVLDQIKAALSKGNEWAEISPLIIAVCSSPEFGCRMKDGRKYYAFDTGMSLALLMLVSTELGLVAHAIAGYDQSRVKIALGVPDEVEVLTLVVMGKPSAGSGSGLSKKQLEAERKRPNRLPENNYVFFNRYDAE